MELTIYIYKSHIIQYNLINKGDNCTHVCLLCRLSFPFTMSGSSRANWSSVSMAMRSVRPLFFVSLLYVHNKSPFIMNGENLEIDNSLIWVPINVLSGQIKRNAVWK